MSDAREVIRLRGLREDSSGGVLIPPFDGGRLNISECDMCEGCDNKLLDP